MNELMRQILFLPPQASSMAREIDSLHYSIISLTMLGSVVVAVVAAYFAIRYRKSANRGNNLPDTRPHHTAGGSPYWFEFVMIFGLLGLFVTWWVIGFRQFVKLETPPPGALEIQVIAKKWMWSFAYPNGGTSNAAVYVPVGRPIKLILTSRDVIHSFFVPPFRVKQDVVPGQTTTVWFQVDTPGEYPVYCAEYCGTNHSTMRASVVAVSAEEFARRTQNMPKLSLPGPKSEEPGELPQYRAEGVTLAKMGQEVAASHGCLRCHTVDGTPHIGPTWAGMYQSEVPLDDGESVQADEAYITESMMDPRAKIHRGFAAVMPTYQGLLQAAEVGALVEYIRSLRDVSEELEQAPLAPADAPPLDLPHAPSAASAPEPGPVVELPRHAPPVGAGGSP